MILSLLLALSVAAAPPRPILWTSTVTAWASQGFGDGHKVRRYQRGPTGRQPVVPDWFAPVNIGFRSMTLTTTGVEYTLTAPAMRWAVAEYVGVSGSVAWRVSRGGGDWTGQMLTCDSMVVLPSARTTGGTLIGFTPRQPGYVLNLWWGD